MPGLTRRLRKVPGSPWWWWWCWWWWGPQPPWLEGGQPSAQRPTAAEVGPRLTGLWTPLNSQPTWFSICQQRSGRRMEPGVTGGGQTVV